MVRTFINRHQRNLQPCSRHLESAHEFRSIAARMPGISEQAGEHEIVVPGKFPRLLKNGKTKKWYLKIHTNRLAEDAASRGTQKLTRNFTLLRRDMDADGNELPEFDWPSINVSKKKGDRWEQRCRPQDKVA